QKIKELDFVNEELKKQLITAKERKPQKEISRDLLKHIIGKYDKQEYGLFSRVPHTLNKLKNLLLISPTPTFTETEVELCLEDASLFRNPLVKEKLSNYERLILDLAEAFTKKRVMPSRQH